jgi:hypothetical protein
MSDIEENWPDITDLPPDDTTSKLDADLERVMLTFAADLATDVESKGTHIIRGKVGAWHNAFMRLLLRQAAIVARDCKAELDRLRGVAETQANSFAKLEAENAALRKEKAHPDAEHVIELEAENFALKAELKMVNGQLKTVLNNWGATKANLARSQEELDRRLAEPPEQSFADEAERLKRRIATLERQNADIRDRMQRAKDELQRL